MRSAWSAACFGAVLCVRGNKMGKIDIDGETFELVAKLLGVRTDGQMEMFWFMRACEEPIDISGISTAQDAQNAHRYNYNESDKWARALLAKWKDLSLEESRSATTLDEVRAAYISSPFDSEGEMVAMRKWLGFCSTAKDVEEIYPHYYTKQTCGRLWDSRAWLMLLEKHLSLLSNFEDLCELQRRVPSRTIGVKLVKQRFNDFSIEKIRAAKTVDEVREAYRFSEENFHSYDVGREAIKKVLNCFVQHRCPSQGKVT